MLIGNYLTYQYESMIPKLLKKKKRGRPRKDEQNSLMQAQKTKPKSKQKQNDSINMDINKLLTNNYEQEIAPGIRHLLNLDDPYNDYLKFLIRCNRRSIDERMTRSDQKMV